MTLASSLWTSGTHTSDLGYGRRFCLHPCVSLDACLTLRSEDADTAQCDCGLDARRLASLRLVLGE